MRNTKPSANQNIPEFESFCAVPGEGPDSWERIVLRGKFFFNLVVDLFAVLAPEVGREWKHCEAVLVEVEVEGGTPLDHEAGLFSLALDRHHGQPHGASRLEDLLPSVELTHGTGQDEVGPLVTGVNHAGGEVGRFDPEVTLEEVTEQDGQGDWGGAR